MFETCKYTFTPVAYFTKSYSGTGSKKNVTRFEQEHVQNSVQKVLENRRKNERELGPRREFPFDPVPTRFPLRQSSGSRVGPEYTKYANVNTIALSSGWRLIRWTALTTF